MPELPEVETIRRGLEGRVEKLEILGIEASGFQNLSDRSCRVGEPRWKGRALRLWNGWGSFSFFGCRERTLVIHLGMTGQLTLRQPQVADAARVSFATPSRVCSVFASTRRIGTLTFRFILKTAHLSCIGTLECSGKSILLSPAEAARDRFFARLGLEPFSEEYQLEGISGAAFAGRTLAVKSLLLDQRFVAGVGNIYADEALFRSQHPSLETSDDASPL